MYFEFLNHFRTWNLNHTGVPYYTVPNREYDALEVAWSEIGHSPEAWFGIVEIFARVQTRRDSLAVGAKVVAVVDVEVRVDLGLVAE